MVIDKSYSCIKLKLPNGKVVDLLSPFLEEISKWIQNSPEKPESGGYIVGYKHKRTGNISIEAASHPYSKDIRSRVRFNIRDSRHKMLLKKYEKEKSYYMGVWHTHPQEFPIPSLIDWDDWRKTIREDRTGCEYVFFVIVGTEEFRVWIGEFTTGMITEVFEYEKSQSGIYLSGELAE